MRKEFRADAEMMERRLWSVYEWELEFLCMHILAHGLWGQRTQYTIRDIRCTGELANDMRNLEDAIFGEYSKKGTDNRIMRHAFRMFHRQFVWQNPAHLSHIYRYYKIFSEPYLSGLFKDQTGLTVQEIVQIGFSTFSMFFKSYKYILPIRSQIPSISDEKIKLFLDSFATHLYDLQNKIAQHNTYDEDLFYKYNPMRESPLIIIEGHLYCPLLPMFLWQFTSGLYYRLYDKPGFSGPFGKSFQEYVGLILQKATDSNRFTIVPEAKYKVGKETKDSIDWILEDQSGYLFLECKTKRLLLSAKGKLMDDTDLNSELDKMAGFVVQGYKTIIDCRNGLYTNINYDISKSGFLLLLTLEDWFINFHPVYHQQLIPVVIQKLQNISIDPIILDTVPYFIESIASFERNIQLVNHLGIQDYYTKLKANTIIDDSNKFEYEELLIDDFKNEISNNLVNPS